MTKPSPRNSLSDPYIKTSLVPRMKIDSETFGRASEAFARYMGTSKFIMQMTVFVTAWFVWNAVVPDHLKFDPYPFQFMTLALSLQASYAAPLILLAQNRQDDRDRISMDEDRSRAAQTKADTEYLARELAALRMKIGDVTTRDYLRSELDRVRHELAELTEVLRSGQLPGAAEQTPGRKKSDGKPKKDSTAKPPGRVSADGGAAVRKRTEGTGES